MSGKKKKIITKAMKLFANKGYHTTSIKEIADESGIAKGTFYNYFDSKEHLLVSILHFYFDVISQKLSMVDKDKSLTPREALMKQFQLQFESVVLNRDFIVMYIREHTAQVNDEANHLFMKMRVSQLKRIIVGLQNIYGTKIEPFIFDCASIINGIIDVYVHYIILDKKDFDLVKLSKYILNRVDDLVIGLCNSKETILSAEDLADFMQISSIEKEKVMGKLSETIQAIYQKVEQENIDSETISKINSSLNIIEEECFKKEEPKTIVLEGLILFLRNLNLPSLNNCWDTLSEDLNEYVIVDK